MSAPPGGLRLEMAPMQGLTGYVFRAVYLRHFAGVDQCYCPFVRLKNGALPGRDQRELEAGRTAGPGFTPQIIAANPSEAQTLGALLVDLGYGRVNLNLGCPYPMETRRRRGAGLLPFPDEVDRVLETLCRFTPALQVSVKTRLGLVRGDALGALRPVFERYPLSSLIVHPRTARQMYEGTPDWQAFGEQTRGLGIPVVANGDILTVDDARRLQQRFPWIAGLMIGRGLLRDPFLPEAIQGQALPGARLQRLRRFHDALLEAYQQAGLTEAHVLDKMRPLWAYLAHSFAEPEQVAKNFKRARRMHRYQDAIAALFG
ncbi:MAG: tRNA-dihydrouridine synthase family protein [Pseudomonadota bacterium]